MTISIQQLQRGLSRYINLEMISKMTGAKRWVFGAAAEIYTGNIAKIINTLKANPMIAMLDVIDENDRIDIDKLYGAILRQADQGSITVDMPLVGAFTFGRGDVEALYNYIQESGGEQQ